MKKRPPIIRETRPAAPTAPSLDVDDLLYVTPDGVRVRRPALVD